MGGPLRSKRENLRQDVLFIMTAGEPASLINPRAGDGQYHDSCVRGYRFQSFTTNDPSLSIFT